jgi:hypothetical protein
MEVMSTCVELLTVGFTIAWLCWGLLEYFKIFPFGLVFGDHPEKTFFLSQLNGKHHPANWVVEEKSQSIRGSQPLWCFSNFVFSALPLPSMRPLCPAPNSFCLTFSKEQTSVRLLG